MSTIKVKVVFRSKTSGRLQREVVQGVAVPYETITVGDLTDRLAETEAHLSRITGLDVKIETASE